MSASPKTAPIYITSGEPAGIGPDICLALAGATNSIENRVLVVLADLALMQARARQLNVHITFIIYDGQYIPAPKGSLYILPITCADSVVCGQLNPANASYVLEQLHCAGQAAMTGKCAAIVTAPVQKSVMNEAGIAFSGHTEFFAELAGVPHVVMMLATQTLRVALVTTHLPLRAVADAITPALLEQIITILWHDLKQHFGISNPVVKVCGLNPHAGEQGYLGREEIDVLIPVIHQFQQRGMCISGPLAADTLFTAQHLQGTDAVLAMYHDQGLPVLKSQGFGEAVNVTLGLPFIRTSVDHGTALALAGTGKAEASSLFAATTMACQMIDARNRRSME